MVLVMAGQGRAEWMRDPQRQYYIDVPAGWFTNAYREAAGGGTRILALAARDGTTVVRVRAAPAAPATRPEDLQTAFERDVLGGAQPEKTGVGRIGPRRALQATYRWTLAGIEYAVVARFVVSSKYGRHTGFVLWRLVPAAAAEGLRGAADGILDSFSFLRPAGFRARFGKQGEGGEGIAAAPPHVRGLLGDLAFMGAAPEEPPAAQPEPAEPPAESEPAAPLPQQASETIVVPGKSQQEPAKPEPQPEEPSPQPAVAETPPEPPAAETPEKPSKAEPPAAEAPPVAAGTEPEEAETPPKPAAPPAPAQPAGPAGPSQCLDATTESACGCTMGDLQTAFGELEETYFASMDGAEEMQETAERIKADMDAAGGCPKHLYRKVVRLLRHRSDPDVPWASARAEQVRRCGDLYIARFGERREREPANRTLDQVIESARVLKYDSLLLLAEFEKVKSARATTARILGDARAACELIHGPVE